MAKTPCKLRWTPQAKYCKVAPSSNNPSIIYYVKSLGDSMMGGSSGGGWSIAQQRSCTICNNMSCEMGCPQQVPYQSGNWYCPHSGQYYEVPGGSVGCYNDCDSNAHTGTTEGIYDALTLQKIPDGVLGLGRGLYQINMSAPGSPGGSSPGGRQLVTIQDAGFGLTTLAAECPEYLDSPPECLDPNSYSYQNWQADSSWFVEVPLVLKVQAFWADSYQGGFNPLIDKNACTRYWNGVPNCQLDIGDIDDWTGYCSYASKSATMGYNGRHCTTANQNAAWDDVFYPMMDIGHDLDYVPPPNPFDAFGVLPGGALPDPVIHYM
jgi:hypothetical protein